MAKNLNLAIYSTFCGSSKNSTFNPAPVNENYAYYFISNNEKILKKAKNSGWKAIFLDKEIYDDPTKSAYQAKFAKAMPHKFNELKKYDFTFYTDDKLIPNITKIENSIYELNNSNSCLGIRAHPFLKNNILFEFGESMLQSRYKVEWEKTVEYINSEINNGYKLESQMYWTSAVLRNMKHEDINLINETWYNHIQKCGIECQISFNFISQRFNSISLLPNDICD